MAGVRHANAVGLLLAVVFQQNIWLLVVGFTISQMALRSLAGVFWAMPPQFLGGAAAAAGIALINSIGNLGGFVGPDLIGALLDLTGGYTGGLLALTVRPHRASRSRAAGSEAAATRARRLESRASSHHDLRHLFEPEHRPTCPRRDDDGTQADSFQSIRFSSPQRLLDVDRLMASPTRSAPPVRTAA